MLGKLIWGWAYHLLKLFLDLLERKPMATANDAYNSTVVDTTNVTADQAKLDADKTTQVNDNAELVSIVVAQGPTLVTDTTGAFVALIPQDDGTLQHVTLIDGSKTPAAPAPTN